MDKVSCFLLGMLIGACLCALISIIVTKNIKEPTAMDVYRCKTTLEITYKDGVAIDSVVVFKDKEK